MLENSKEPDLAKDSADSEAELARFAGDHAIMIAHEYMVEGARTWKRADGFSTWVTAAAGASLGVAISQLALIRAALGMGMARALLWSLALSILAGLFAKYMGFSVGVSLALGDVNLKITEKFLAEKEHDLEKIRLSPNVIKNYLAPVMFIYKKQMRPAIPYPLRRFADSIWNKSLFRANDSRAGLLRWFLWQLVAIHLQVAALIVAVLIAAFAV
jgi:hypothetical protein